ncbi:YIP1 family protein [Frigidibacter sp. MR17.24]|uniref:YIP1 family protein n=1 Tax=Frigidibacter sp. MR17.24 TaxID=3127345 RepID=UPI003012E32F
MSVDLSGLLGLARLSVAEPRRAARFLIGTGLPMPVRWLALVTVVVCSVVLAQATMMILGAIPADGAAPLGAAVSTAIVQAGVMLVISAGIAQVGRAAGGRGGFADALLLVVWAEVTLLLLQVAQLVAGLAVPLLADLLLVAGMVIFFWQLTQFTMELHGFTSAVKVFFALLGGFFVAGFVMLTVLGIVGLTPAGMGF